MTKLPSWLTSSTGEGLSKRWESIFSGIVPIILVLSPLFGWGVVEADLSELNGQIVAGIAGIVAVWKSISFVQGWIRAKFYKKNGLGKFSEFAK